MSRQFQGWDTIGFLCHYILLLPPPNLTPSSQLPSLSLPPPNLPPSSPRVSLSQMKGLSVVHCTVLPSYQTTLSLICGGLMEWVDLMQNQLYSNPISLWMSLTLYASELSCIIIKLGRNEGLEHPFSYGCMTNSVYIIVGIIKGEVYKFTSLKISRWLKYVCTWKTCA